MNFEIEFPPAPPMTRANDDESAEDAANRVALHVVGLRAAVLAAVAAMEPTTALEVEALKAFDNCRPTTVRKRCSELLAMGMLVKGPRRQVTLEDGTVTSAMTLTVSPEGRAFVS